MVVVAMVLVIVGGVDVAKVLVWAEAIGDMVVVVEVLVIDVLTDVEIIVAGVIVIDWKFALSVSYSVDMSSSDVVIDLFVDALVGMMIGILTGIGIESLADMNANTFGAVMTALELPVPTPLEEFIR